ncbi:MAG: M20/M25/M40 family metallo-hydrolase [Solirubrobacteraceae bacterium]|nr:M20/M25/M40 family metallo-hydrolase [Solirubrobacteraceae bacterium]
MAQEWIATHAAEMATTAERETAALVAISSPSGDAPAAERAVAVASALAPGGSRIERLPCSTAEHAPDLLISIDGPGQLKILLVGHLDTVVSHDAFLAPQRSGHHLVGSGTADMKGGVALALGALRALQGRPELGEAALLLVTDEEWRRGQFAHSARFADFDACFCFEAGERSAGGDDAVVVRRKAAGTLKLIAHGRAAHSGSAPEQGVSALLALAEAAQIVAALSDPNGPERLTAVPTILRSGEAINVVPGSGELICDLRADSLAALEAVEASIPSEIAGASIELVRERAWPGMDSREQTAPLLAAAAELLGRPIIAGERGGASDASHFAAAIDITIDGLGPLGEHSHHADEQIDLDSLFPRSELVLALLDVVLRSR